MIRATLALALGAALLAPGPAVRAAGAQADAAGPILVIETVKGTIEIQLFPADAPKTVEHFLALVRRNFYRGLRFHRVESSLIQVGDPLSRDMSRRDYWGRGGSGQPVRVNETSTRRSHRRGTVAMAHSGAPETADSQFFIMKSASPSLDGKHVIIGQVISGMDVVDQIAVADVIRRTELKEAGQP